MEHAPPLITTPEELAMVRDVGTIIEAAGAGKAKVILFLGKPTKDLLVSSDDPARTTERLQEVLAAYPIVVSQVNRFGDLSWERKLWRHK